jgi:hypothetical protein
MITLNSYIFVLSFLALSLRNNALMEHEIFILGENLLGY